MNTDKKKKLGIGCGILAIAVLLCLSVFSTNWNKNRIVLENMELGERCLLEEDYEAAIIAFTKVIETDSMCVEAYLKVAEAYIGAGDYDSALEQLEAGYERTGDAAILNMLEELGKSHTEGAQPSSGPETLNGAFDKYLQEDWIRAEEWTINGTPFWQASRADVEAVCSSDGYSGIIEGTIGYSATNASFTWSETEGKLILADFYSGDSNTEPTMIQSSRGIFTSSDFVSVLSAIGVSDEGIEEILKVLPTMEDNVTIPPLRAGTEDYALEIWITHDEEGAKSVSLDYEFFTGMRLIINMWFGIDTDLFDYGGIHVLYDGF